MRPFRFAVQLSDAPTGRDWRDLARKVEDLGYSTLFIPDHFDKQLGPVVALTVAAEATERLKVGSLVFDNDYRHPLVMAKELATLDFFSEGRLEVGLGAGWMQSDYDQSGIAHDPAGTRVSRMEEAIAVYKALWSGETANLEGEHYRIHGARGYPRPHGGRAHPPLLIGGGSPRVLRIAGREADIVGINPNLAAGHIGAEMATQVSARHYAERIEWVREGAGDRFDEIELQCLTFLVTVGEPRTDVLERLSMMFSMPPEDAGDVPLALGGTVDEIVEVLQQRRETLGLTYWVVHEAELESFAGVVAKLAGA
jgi:probable F420-dependent oxidoreductase